MRVSMSLPLRSRKAVEEGNNLCLQPWHIIDGACWHRRRYWVEMIEVGLERHEDDDGFHRLMKNELGKSIPISFWENICLVWSPAPRTGFPTLSLRILLQPSTLSTLKPQISVFLNTLPRMFHASVISGSNSVKNMMRIAFLMMLRCRLYSSCWIEWKSKEEVQTGEENESDGISPKLKTN